MSAADIVAAVLCLGLPLATMLVAIAAITWTRQEIATMLRGWMNGQ